MHTGIVILSTRKALKLTQAELAELADVDRATVSRIERGLYNAPARTIKALTDALGQRLAEKDGAR